MESKYKEPENLFEEIYPALESFEIKRKKEIRWGQILLLLFVLISITVVTLLAIFTNPVYAILFIPLSIGFFLIISFSNKIQKKFVSDFIQALFAKQNIEASVNLTDSIAKDMFNKLNVFNETDETTGRLLINGHFDENFFSSSYMKASFIWPRSYPTSLDLGKNTFDGFYFIAKINKDKNIQLILQSRDFNDFKKGSFKASSLDLGNYQVENSFKIRHNNFSIAKRILKSDFSDKLHAFKLKYDSPIHIKILKDHMYILLSDPPNLFALGENEKLDDPKVVERFEKDFRFYTEILELVKLIAIV